MENEMVGCAIEFFFFFFFLPSCQLPQRDEYSLMPGREGNEISALPLSVSLSFHRCLSEADGLVHRSKKSCFIVITKKKHFISVSEAPTVLCGLIASKNLKSFLLQHIILEDHYMIYSLGGENHILIPPRCCFSGSKRRLEEGSEVLRVGFNCVWLALTFLNSNSRRKQKEKGICGFLGVWQTKLFAKTKQKNKSLRFKF